MAAKNLLDSIKNGHVINKNGINAVLAECSNRDIVKALKRATGGRNANIQFQIDNGDVFAILDYSGECEECDITKRAVRTGNLKEIFLLDFGMALQLKDDQHLYLLNLETPLTL